MDPILPYVFENGLTLFEDNLTRGLGCMAGIIPTHEIPVTKTDEKTILEAVNSSGGFGFAVTRTAKPGLVSYQRGIDGVTRSPWGHGIAIIGEDIGKAARMAKPGLLVPQPSTRWENLKEGYPKPLVGGIAPIPVPFECVESKALVSVTSLKNSLDEQVIIFINPNWTREQKIAMACEAYSWVGEPYDIFEIGHWVMPFIPNPKNAKACSTLVLQIIAAGDPEIKSWCSRHALNPELIAPRDLFAYGVDKSFNAFGVNCTVRDAVNVLA